VIWHGNDQTYNDYVAADGCRISKRYVAEDLEMADTPTTAPDYDIDKLDEVVLALLYLNSFRDRDEIRAWKGLDWDALDRLHERGLISDPARKAKSVALSEEGFEQAKAVFRRLFGIGA
jgi:hypothetical protein